VTSHAASASGVSSSDDVGSDELQELVHEHPTVFALGRIGWVSKGIVYGLVGFLALTIALGDRSEVSPDDEASQTGAITRIAQASYGTAVLVVVASGLVVYAIWRIITVMLPAKNDAHTWVTRIGYAVSAIVYLALAWTASSYVRDTQSSEAGAVSEESRVDAATREVMSHTGGQWLVGLVGIVILAVGAYFFVRAVRRPFEDQLIGGGVGPFEHRHIVVMGRIGWIGRSLMMLLIGFFLVRAAWRSDASEATGLDGALRRAVENPVGTGLVAAVGIGLIVYGAYCVISAPRRRLAPADS
jgi:hypothetical protein